MYSGVSSALDLCYTLRGICMYQKIEEQTLSTMANDGRVNWAILNLLSMKQMFFQPWTKRSSGQKESIKNKLHWYTHI